MADNGFEKLSMQVDDRDVYIGQDDALPSVETTMRFLALCDRYGPPEAAVAAVAQGGVPACRGCPTGASGRCGPPPRCVRRSSTFWISRSPPCRPCANVGSFVLRTTEQEDVAMLRSPLTLGFDARPESRWGIDTAGRKHFLHLPGDATQTAAVATGPLSGLMIRGLPTDGTLLSVIAGAQRLHSVHHGHPRFSWCPVTLPRAQVQEHARPSTRAAARLCRQGGTGHLGPRFGESRRAAAQAPAPLGRDHLVGAAVSVRERLDETPTVQRLSPTSAFRRTSRTTNITENLNGTVECYAPNVKRWRGHPMCQRRVAIDFGRGGTALPADPGLPPSTATSVLPDKCVYPMPACGQHLNWCTAAALDAERDSQRRCSSLGHAAGGGNKVAPIVGQDTSSPRSTRWPRPTAWSLAWRNTNDFPQEESPQLRNRRFVPERHVVISALTEATVILETGPTADPFTETDELTPSAHFWLIDQAPSDTANSRPLIRIFRFRPESSVDGARQVKSKDGWWAPTDPPVNTPCFGTPRQPGTTHD